MAFPSDLNAREPKLPNGWAWRILSSKRRASFRG
jgi:hypothetical protein